MWISPEVGRSSPAIMRSSVVFPEPEEPSRTRNSPSRIDRSTPSTACRSPKCFLRLRISMPATVAALTPGLPPVGRGVRCLRQVHRRVVNDAVGVLGHLQVLHHRRGWAGGRPCLPARSTASRVIVDPVASGVVSRLRRRLLPSDASSAASSSPQIWLGRAFTPHPCGGRWRMVEVREDGGGRAGATSTNLHQPPPTFPNLAAP